MLPKLANRDEIILVDDNEMEHLFIKQYFKIAALTQPLVSFRNGSDFLAYMDGVATKVNKMPAIVLLDIQMPDSDGFDVLEKLRKNSNFSQLPVVLMFSSSDAPSDMQRALDLGANGYQTKPTGLQEIDAFFKALLKE
jgi:DNA-binding response OmpR family regulator